MKHIVFLALPLSRGGAERVIANLCNDALSSKYRVTVITCMNRPVGYELKPEIEKFVGLWTQKFQIKQGGNSPNPTMPISKIVTYINTLLLVVILILS